jgi:hypothetical protein
VPAKSIDKLISMHYVCLGFLAYVHGCSPPRELTRPTRAPIGVTLGRPPRRSPPRPLHDEPGWLAIGA